MLTLGLLMVASAASISALSAFILCRSEIIQKRETAKEANAGRKLQKIRRSYAKERLKEREQYSRNISALDKLLEESSIDSETHERYKKILIIDHEDKRQQTRKKFGLTKKLPA